ncbi:MAG TPA: hypothetical protein VG944_00585 [Fimbriimonas sp.]|nr:hypothetical protein [Fimbriimonas sp.]
MQIATLIIAVVGIVLAGLSLGWQAATFTLSGPRVKVNLREGFRGPRGIMIAPPAVYTDNGLETLAQQGYSEHVLAVEAINRGRLPATIENWSLRFGNGAAYSNPTDGGNLSLPYRLDSHTRANWYAPAANLRELQGIFTDQTESAAILRAEVSLGSGQTAVSRNALRVRADSITELPPSLPRKMLHKLQLGSH